MLGHPVNANGWDGRIPSVNWTFSTCDLLVHLVISDLVAFSLSRSYCEKWIGFTFLTIWIWLV